MKYLKLVLQILLGAIFVVFGLNFFFNFIPMGEPKLSAGAMAFFTATYATGYMAVVKALEVIGGLLLLSNRFVAVGLTILGPIVLNIFLFHLLLAPDGLPMGAALLVFESALLYFYRNRFKGIFHR